MPPHTFSKISSYYLMSRHKVPKTFPVWKEDKTVKRSISFPKQHNTPSSSPFLLHKTCTALVPSHSLTCLNAQYWFKAPSWAPRGTVSVLHTVPHKGSVPRFINSHSHKPLRPKAAAPGAKYRRVIAQEGESPLIPFFNNQTWFSFQLLNNFP